MAAGAILGVDIAGHAAPLAALIFGDDSEDVFPLGAGRLGMQVPGPDGTPIRLRSMRTALMVEVAGCAAASRTADVIAETGGVVYRAQPRVRADIAEREPELATAWRRMIAVALAEKRHRTNRILGEQ